MELCSDGHDEICFSERKCPLCAMRDDYEDKLHDANDAKEQAENEADSYKSEARELKSQLESVQAELNRLYVGQSDGER